MTAHIPYLPAEMHRLIARYVQREDLPSYRLVSRQLCEIGTEELFSTIAFQYSTASIDRLSKLSSTERLRKHVKTIFWDTNLWSWINIHKYNEWERIFDHMALVNQDRDAGLYLDDLHASGHTRSSQNRRDWEAHLGRMADEITAKNGLERLQVLGRFQNLQSIHVVNGRLLSAHRGLQKVAQEFSNIIREVAELPRGMGVYSCGSLPRGMGIDGSDIMPGVEAFKTIQHCCHSYLRNLTLDTIALRSFISSTPGNFDNLSSLDITTFPRMRLYPDHKELTAVMMDGLGEFLARAPQLANLRIDLGDQHARNSVNDALSSIHRVFGYKHTWPKLRKLSLRHFSATPNALLSFLDRHSSTLKNLRLHSINWRAAESGTSEQKLRALATFVEHCAWPHVLQQMSKILFLEHAVVTGQLGENIFMRGWQLLKGNELAAAVSDYLVRGGQCPLTADNADFNPPDREFENEEGFYTLSISTASL